MERKQIRKTILDAPAMDVRVPTPTNYGGSSIAVLDTTCGDGTRWPGSGWKNNKASCVHYG